MKLAPLALLVLFSLFLFGCTQTPVPTATSTPFPTAAVGTATASPTIQAFVGTPAPTTPSQAVATPRPTAKPQTGEVTLGDGKYSSTPKVGFIFSCQQSFNSQQGGAGTDGPWIHGSTYDPDAKEHVHGEVFWKQATFAVTDEGNVRKFTGNGLPVDDPTGIYPIQSTDAAYAYDRNPNGIKEQTVSLSVPLNPTLASTPSCVGGGEIGYAVNGVPFYNGFDAGGRDAVAHELQDECGGHPQVSGQYHYHSNSKCLDQTGLLGYALDGFPIYSETDAQGNALTTKDLDECHGRTSIIEWKGQQVEMYHYVATRDFPYIVGCFRGTPTRIQMGQGSQQGGMGGQQGPPGMGPPPFGMGPPPQ